MAASITNLISLYTGLKNVKSKEVIPLDIFFENIRNGKWEDIAHSIRTLATKEERDEAKKKAPSVTLSGQFEERTDKGLLKHSGYIGIDIDNCDVNEIKETLANDRYVVAAFTSISGRGLCVVFRVVPERHRDAFNGISEYLYNTYQIICDPTSVNVSRARFVSYDPDIFVNNSPEKFTLYPKNKPPKKLDKAIFCPEDFKELLEEIISRRLNICENYHEWLRIGFAIASKFGEPGREYFHTVSQYSSKYNPTIVDKQFNACLRSRTSGETTIATFYYYCKEAGLQIYSQRTKIIAYSAIQGKKAGLSAQDVAANLAKFEGITAAEDIIKQVMDNDIQLSEDTLLDQLEIWMRQNYSLQRNLITRYIENYGEIVEQKDLNTIFIKAKKIFEKLTYELVDRLIHSDFVPSFNPLLRWFEEQGATTANKGLQPGAQMQLQANEGGILSPEPPNQPNPQTGGQAKEGGAPAFIQQTEFPDLSVPVPTPQMDKLFGSITTKDSKYVLYFGRKWFVGIISSIYGEHTVLMPVLSGEKLNTGKTQFFRRLLPKELKKYYAESKLDAGKDDEILMTQKLIIMDDEMAGKSKKEDKKMKDLTSKQVFSLREPYGRNNVDLVRLAALCGTTNEEDILSESANRRVVPMYVESINHSAYNSVDKRELLVEAFRLYHAGYPHELTNEDIKYLESFSTGFEMISSETELIQKYFEPGEGVMMTATDIKVYIEKHTNQRLSLDRIAKQLKRQGFEQRHIKTGKTTKRVYMVIHLSGSFKDETLPPEHPEDDVPF